MSEAPKPRPEFRNINIFNDVRTYRLPLAGWVSILHRASGALMFLLLPFIIWLFDIRFLPKSRSGSSAPPSRPGSGCFRAGSSSWSCWR